MTRYFSNGIDETNRKDFKMKGSMIAVLLVALCMVTRADATNYFCTGTITWLSMASDGTVFVGGPGGVPVAVHLCNINTTDTNGIGAQTCKSYYATLLAARLSGAQVSIDFSDSLSCSTQPAWGATVSLYHLHQD